MSYPKKAVMRRTYKKERTPHPAIHRGLFSVWGYYKDSEWDRVSAAIVKELRQQGWLRTYRERTNR